MTATHTESTDPLTVLVVDDQSPTPPFRQLHDAVVTAVSSRTLRPGQKLPTTRALAAHLGLAVNTVASAYKALEATGVVEGRGRAGTFIALGSDPVLAEARRVALDAAHQLRALGVSAERAHVIVREALEASDLASD